jgi:hypothetical protein
MRYREVNFVDEIKSEQEMQSSSFNTLCVLNRGTVACMRSNLRHGRVVPAYGCASLVTRVHRKKLRGREG